MNCLLNRSFCRKTLTSLVGALLLTSLFATHLLAQGTDAKGSESEQPKVIEPMNTEGLDPKLARVLRNYYEKNFTSAENWEQLQSIIYEGELITPENTTRFVAYKKKPDLCKYVLHIPGGRRVILAYDGEHAWQYDPTLSQPVPMPPAEERNFIRDAPISNHLLYPLAPGKKIRLSEIVTVDGDQCYEIVVDLPDGQQIRTAVDIVTYAERKSITVNNVNGMEEHTTYSNFFMQDGIRFARTANMTTGGQHSHRIEISRVRANTGVTSSMFLSSSVSLDDGENLKPGGFEQFQIKAPDSPSTNGFGDAPFGESLFPDLETK